MVDVGRALSEALRTVVLVMVLHILGAKIDALAVGHGSRCCRRIARAGWRVEIGVVKRGL